MYHKKRQRNVLEETLFQYHLMTEKKEWGKTNQKELSTGNGNSQPFVLRLVSNTF